MTLIGLKHNFGNFGNWCEKLRGGVGYLLKEGLKVVTQKVIIHVANYNIG